MKLRTVSFRGGCAGGRGRGREGHMGIQQMDVQTLVIMKIPCMNKSMVIMNNGQLIINSLWSNSIHEQLFIKLLWTTDHAWTIGLSIWTIDHMANCSCMNKLFIIYEQLFIISKIVHKLFIAWTIGHSMDNPSDIHKILNGCFLLYRFITNLWSFFRPTWVSASPLLVSWSVSQLVSQSVSQSVS